MKAAKAALFYGLDKPLAIEDVSVAAPLDDEILVKIHAVGICHTDLTLMHYPIPTPVILGHEGAGVVEQVGKNITHVAPGDHVVITMDYCGQCKTCKKQRYFYCQQSVPRNFSWYRSDGSPTVSLDGKPVAAKFFNQSSFASYAIGSANNVVKVTSEVPLKLLGPLACGIQTGAGTVINELDAGPEDSIAVFGVGAVGLAAVMAAKIRNCQRIIAVDLNADRLQLALNLGATDVVNPADADVIESIKSLTDGGVDFAVEATGKPVVVEQAFDSLNGTGTCVSLGAMFPDAVAKINVGNLLPGRILKGVTEGSSDPHSFIPYMIDQFVAGNFPFDQLITEYKFEEINRALADCQEGKTIKPILVMDGIA